MFLYLVSGAFHLEQRRINDEHGLKYIYTGVSIYRKMLHKTRTRKKRTFREER